MRTIKLHKLHSSTQSAHRSQPINAHTQPKFKEKETSIVSKLPVTANTFNLNSIVIGPQYFCPLSY